MSAPDLATIALAEFARRRSAATEAVRARQLTQRRAHDLACLWAAIAAWFGAELPGDALPHEGEVSWLDFHPAETRADSALAAMADELARAAQVALARAEQTPEADPARPDHTARAAGLLRLHNALAPHANRPPLALARRQDAAGALPKEAA